MLLPCRGAPATVLQTMAIAGWKQHRHREDADAYATLSFIVFAVLVVFVFLVTLSTLEPRFQKLWQSS